MNDSSHVSGLDRKKNILAFSDDTVRLAHLKELLEPEYQVIPVFAYPADQKAAILKENPWIYGCISDILELGNIIRNPQEALKNSELPGMPVDCIVADYELNSIVKNAPTGTSLLASLRLRHRNTKIIFYTGAQGQYFTIAQDEGERLGGAPVISTSQPEELLAAVHQALGTSMNR